jgi:hypothetical protein
MLKMKWTGFLLVVFCLVLSGFGEDVKYNGVISGVNVSSGSNKEGGNVDILRANTLQNGPVFPGFLRATVEMTDKEDNVFRGESVSGSAAGEVTGGEFKGRKFTGAVRWEVDVEHGDLKRPRITAYVVEYGYMDGKNFVCLDKECYRVESREDLLERTKEAGKLTVKRARTTSTIN